MSTSSVTRAGGGMLSTLAERLNGLALMAGGAENLIDLSPDDCIRVACEISGLDDFGADAESYIATFRRRLKAIDEESGATVVGRLLARGEVIRVLQTKLRLEELWRCSPEVAEEQITTPIFIVGAPRTGTTITFEMLNQDPRLRAPLGWETCYPVPLVETQEHQSNPDTRRLAESEHDIWSDILPAIDRVHELRADIPAECVFLMNLDFGSGYWSMLYDTPGFDSWIDDNAESYYTLHRRLLQSLQWQDRRNNKKPKIWLLKSPGHLLSLSDLVREYPDARLVMTHRDPVDWVASASSTTSFFRLLRSERVDFRAQGRLINEGLGYVTGAVESLRETGLVGVTVADVYYDDLLGDPVATIRAIYETLGIEWSPKVARRIVEYVGTHAQGRYGVHHYNLDDFDLTSEDVFSSFGTYLRRQPTVDRRQRPTGSDRSH